MRIGSRTATAINKILDSKRSVKVLKMTMAFFSKQKKSKNPIEFVDSQVLTFAEKSQPWVQNVNSKAQGLDGDLYSLKDDFYFRY